MLGEFTGLDFFALALILFESIISAKSIPNYPESDKYAKYVHGLNIATAIALFGSITIPSASETIFIFGGKLSIPFYVYSIFWGLGVLALATPIFSTMVMASFKTAFYIPCIVTITTLQLVLVFHIFYIS